MALSKKQEHELIKRYFNNPNILKTFLKGQDLAWVNSVYEKFGEVMIEVTQEAALEQAEAQEREKKRLELIALIKAEGWSVEELVKTTISKKPTKKADKYRFPDENGNEKGWSGIGKTPNALKALLDKGHKLEEFLIVKESTSPE